MNTVSSEGDKDSLHSVFRSYYGERVTEEVLSWECVQFYTGETGTKFRWSNRDQKEDWCAVRFPGIVHRWWGCRHEENSTEVIRKSSFEALQKRFDSIPIEMADDDIEGYVHLCDVILQEEGWSEPEYLIEALKRKGVVL